jgi:hypothetical protein
MEYCLESVSRKVTPEMNSSLLKEFTTDEIVNALGQMKLLKGPSPEKFGV